MFALAGAAWLVTLALFVELFRKTFGFDEKQLPLFAFMAGSPFFLKNFMHTLGHFDIYGCALAICLLLIPARSVVFVLLTAVFSVVLVLIHHIHLLMYVPTIFVIVMIRHYLVEGASRQNVAVGIAATLLLGALFGAAQFLGTMPVPEAEFVHYLQGRMADPSRTDLLSFSYIWYQPLSQEIHDTWERMPSNLLGVPVFALLIWLHTPLWRYFAQNDPRACRPMASPPRRRGARWRDARLSHHVRHRIRLFTLDLELGGLHVPDPARGEDDARRAGRATDRERRPPDKGLRLDRDADPARRHRAAVLT
jgi:hypothetical protein